MCKLVKKKSHDDNICFAKTNIMKCRKYPIEFITSNLIYSIFIIYLVDKNTILPFKEIDITSYSFKSCKHFCLNYNDYVFVITHTTI